MSTTKINAVEQIKTGSITSTLTDTSIIDAAGSHPFTAAANLGGFRATNAANGSAATDLVTLSQVQSMLMGLSPLISVQAMTTGSETYTVTSGAVTQINGTTVDGITLIVGDRILVKNAPAASGTGTADSSFAGSQYPANGVYTVTGTGTNLTVSRDSTSNTPLYGTINPAGKFVFSDAGTANKGAGYIVTDPSTPDTAFTYGTSNMMWAKFNSATGSVTTVSVVTANGFTGTVNNASSTPAITLTTNVTGIVKGNGTALSAAVSGTDYAPATSGTSILKGNGSGGTSSAVSGTDYAPATSGTGLLKGNGSGGTSTATSGTDYLAPSEWIGGEAVTGTLNGSNTSFTLANTPNAGMSSPVMLFLNGDFLQSGAGNDYTISGSTITMLYAPATGDKLIAAYWK